MIAFLDFETRSAVDIKTRGAWVYSEDETTDVLCLAIKVDDMAPLIWMNEGITQLRGDLWAPDVWNLIDKADEIHAWNAGFERAIWQNVCHRRYGWPALPIHKLRCTMAKAAYHSLPMSLDAAASALGLPGKDIEGYKLMLKLSKPRKRDPLVWWGDADMFRRLGEYCKEDVNAEARIDAELYQMPDQELKIWQLDQEINARGILADVGACRNAVHMIERDADASLTRFKELTHHSVSSPKQVTAFLKWLHSHGCVLPGLTKADVINYLQMPSLHPEVREALQIRQKLGLSSVSKFQAIIDRVSADGRLRGMFCYHGAGTGRWAGRGVQLQNLPRKSYRADDLAALESGDYDWFDTFETSLPASMSTMVRGMFMAGPGNELAVADYSSIEARVVAWLAGEQKVLTAFREKLDLYKVAATSIYGVRYENVTKDQRQVGKCAVLALGYQGGVGAFQSMAGVYGVRVPDEQAQDIVTKWRSGHQAIVGFWRDLENAATAAVETGRTQTVGALKFGIKGRWLCMKLPSGRSIHYPFPAMDTRPTKWGEDKRGVVFMNSSMGRWVRDHTYGGKLCENCFTAEVLVVTARGAIPIVEVLPSDHVWDGEEWVTTEGPIERGEREVVEWLGVRVTPDHLITDGNSWKSVTASDGPFLLHALLWALYSINSQSFLRTQESMVLRCVYAPAETPPKSQSGIFGAAGLRNVLAAVMQKLGVTGPSKKDTRKLSATETCYPFGAIGTPAWFHDATMKIIERIRITEDAVLGFSSDGWTIGENSSATRRPSPTGINSALISTGLTTMGTTVPEMSDLLSERSIHETHETTHGCSVLEKPCPLRNSMRDSAPNGKAETAYTTTSAETDHQKKWWIYTGTVAPVFDLKNCGPRHRFMILTEAGPVVVHNCVQAVARDLLADALLRVEAAGLPVVLHVHDEVGAEVPQGAVTVEEFERLMATPPAWADGCPIGAEGWIGKRYRK